MPHAAVPRQRRLRLSDAAEFLPVNLGQALEQLFQLRAGHRESMLLPGMALRGDHLEVGLDVLSPHSARSRSEERRVGKECRSRWSPYH